MIKKVWILRYWLPITIIIVSLLGSYTAYLDYVEPLPQWPVVYTDEEAELLYLWIQVGENERLFFLPSPRKEARAAGVKFDPKDLEGKVLTTDPERGRCTLVDPPYTRFHRWLMGQDQYLLGPMKEIRFDR